jgi:hypothetical protein
MRYARGQPKRHVNRPATAGSVRAQPSYSLMKNTLIFTTLLAGLALTACNKSTRTDTATTTDPTVAPATSTDTVGQKVDRAGDRVATASRDVANDVRDASRDAANAMRNAGQDLKARYNEWRLTDNELRADLDANRPIVRTRTAAGAATGRIDDDTIEKAIKGRLHSDSQLADLKFDVNANKQGEVELEGKARSVDQIAHAMGIALDTDGVTKVTSKIKLDPNAGPNRR